MAHKTGFAAKITGGGVAAPSDRMIAAGGALVRQGSFSRAPRRMAVIAPPAHYAPKLDLGELRFARCRIQLRLA